MTDTRDDRTTSKRGQEPAYPVPETEDRTGDLIPAQLQGMSIRLRIASEQMAAMLANPAVVDQWSETGTPNIVQDLAERSVDAADALLAAEEETR